MDVNFIIHNILLRFRAEPSFKGSPVGSLLYFRQLEHTLYSIYT